MQIKKNSIKTFIFSELSFSRVLLKFGYIFDLKSKLSTKFNFFWKNSGLG